MTEFLESKIFYSFIAFQVIRITQWCIHHSVSGINASHLVSNGVRCALLK